MTQEGPPTLDPDIALGIALEIAPGEVRRLLRHPVLASLPRAGRGTPLALTWHRGPGMPDGELACEGEGGWTLERATPPVPGGLARVLRRGHTAADIVDTPDLLQPAGRFEGRRRIMAAGGRSLTVLDGALIGDGASLPCCRIYLRGLSAAEIGQLAAALPLRVPALPLGLAAAVQAGSDPPTPALGAPAIGQGSLEQAVGTVVRHLAGVVLHWMPLVHTDTDGTAIHQARVGVRRLRSAFGVFRAVLAGPDTDALAAGLKDVFTRLGAVRDWDVFLDSTGPDAAAAAPDDPRLPALLDQARGRQAAQRTELRAWLAGPAWRRLAVNLATYAVLQPWLRAGAERDALLAEDAATAARHALRRIRRKTLRIDASPSTLPIEALHDLRKRCKRLRYAAEFFAPLFPGKPTRRFLRRLAAVQEIMGHLNDSAVAGGLMAQLGRDRSFAAGVVLGWTAARRTGAQAGLDKAWHRLKQADPFWT